MAHHLVIMESPAKAKTVQGYLGSGYKVIGCTGHIRDLPKSSLGVNIENHFEPHYINIRGKGELIRELRKQAKNAASVFLATDPDREGEAISWHLAAILGIPADKARRVTCNEITRTAFKKAIGQPRPIDMDLVNAQQARRILDRIVGYQLSPYLWKTVRSGLSAGRVQSVATRIIVERENEIRAFVPKESWSITALLKKPEDGENRAFQAKFFGRYGEKPEKVELLCEDDAKAILKKTEGKPFRVVSVKKSRKQRNPAPPFITSTLQQEGGRRLGFQTSRTMRVAQELYEGVNLGAELGGSAGLITYMRTDSLRIAESASDAAREFILSQYGKDYFPPKPRVYKTKSGAQDAHEAIRPVNMALTPDRVRKSLTADQYKLYKLIFDRFVASQMACALIDTVTADSECGGCLFRSTGSTVRFRGFLCVYEEGRDAPAGDAPTGAEEGEQGALPPLAEGDGLVCLSRTPKQHFSEPPQRFSEGSLIKFLEEKGIGRPSTFATIISTIIDRGYVARDAKALVPTKLGEITNELMLENFANIVDYQFTAQMEQQLDSIENGDAQMENVLESFYRGFEKDLRAALDTAGRKEIALPVEQTDILCEKCGARMIVKSGRFGKFAACPNYPACKNTKALAGDGKSLREEAPPEKVEGMVCEKCGRGMTLRTGRYGKFYACEDYPRCNFTKQISTKIGVPCPKCGGEILLKRGRNRTVFYSCENYPKCDFSSFDLPTMERCPLCAEMLYRKKGKPILFCKKQDCGYKRELPPDEEKESAPAEGKKP